MRAMMITVCLLGVVGVVPAVADPIPVVQGRIDYQRNDAPGAELRGDGFVMPYVFWGWEGDPEPPGLCSRCAEGELFNLSGGTLQNVELSGATFVLFGQTYTVVRSDGTVFSESVRVPPAPTDVDWPFVSVSAPFRFSGLLVGQGSDGEHVRVELTGAGRVNTAFYNYQAGMATWFASTYQFENPAPVPEPGSLLLLATGALTFAARKRRTT